MSRIPSKDISIVTISFNQAAFLEECLMSVLSQKCEEVEYIVVDPGSTDGSRNILTRFADVIELILEPDRGPADGLNNGFAVATGDIFGYINADDRMAPGAIEFVGRFFTRNPDVDVLCGAIRIIDRDGRVSLRGRSADAFDLARYAAGICTIGQQATFFRRRAFELAGGFNPANHITWDGELLVDMALAGARFASVGNVLGDFRIYAESITGSNKHRERARREHERIAEKISARGVPLYSSLKKQLQRALYKGNLLRHLRYLQAR
jgi:glycosyltransferase involved in cell wall biosynthesis